MVSEADVAKAFTLFKAARMVETTPPDDDERLAQMKVWVKILEDEKITHAKFLAACHHAVARDSFFPSVGRICSILEEDKPMGRSPEDCRPVGIEEDIVPPEQLQAAMKKIKDDIKRRKLIDPQAPQDKS